MVTERVSSDTWLTVARKRARELPGSVLKVGVAHDGMATLDAFRLLSDDFHGYRTRDADPLEIPHRRAADIMEQAPMDIRLFAYRLPLL